MTDFAVFANGTFCGSFAANSEAEAIQVFADEYGTEGNTDGMTAKALAAYVAEVREGCASNGVDFDDLVREFFNCTEAEADDKGDVWISGPQTGHWIDAEKKADLIAWVEAV